MMKRKSLKQLRDEIGPLVKDVQFDLSEPLAPDDTPTDGDAVEEQIARQRRAEQDITSAD